MVRGAQRGFVDFVFMERAENGRLFAAEASGKRCASGGGDAPVARQVARCRPPFAQQFRQRRLHHFAQRVLVVARGKVQQLEQRRVQQRRVVQHAGDGFQRAVVCRTFLNADDDANHLPATKRHPHPRADRDRFIT